MVFGQNGKNLYLFYTTSVKYVLAKYNVFSIHCPKTKRKAQRETEGKTKSRFYSWFYNILVMMASLSRVPPFPPLQSEENRIPTAHILSGSGDNI